MITIFLVAEHRHLPIGIHNLPTGRCYFCVYFVEYKENGANDAGKLHNIYRPIFFVQVRLLSREEPDRQISIANWA